MSGDVFVNDDEGFFCSSYYFVLIFSELISQLRSRNENKILQQAFEGYIAYDYLLLDFSELNEADFNRLLKIIKETHKYFSDGKYTRPLKKIRLENALSLIDELIEIMERDQRFMSS